jgi:hypothetical protein
MDWLVKNAQNRDVERQHLNKILQEIRNTLNEFEARMARDSSEEARIRAIVVQMLTTGAQSGINVTYNTTSKAIDFTVRTFTIQLTGDVTGTATVTGLGNVSINTTLTAENEGVEEAPLDGQYYWRSSGAWITVPTPLQTIDIFEGAGILVLDNDYNWFGRSIEGVAGEIEVTDGDGIAGNPSVGLADVVPGVGGELIKLSFDVKGRRFEEAPVTAADLTPLLDPYYEPAGAAAAALAASMVYTDDAVATREPAITPGTDAQVWRGDKVWTNWINGDWRVGTSSGLFGSGRELVVSAGTSGNNIAHMSFQGSRTINGIFGTMNYYHQTNLVVSMGAARDGADDAGYWVISTKPTGGSLTNRMRILSDGSIIIGSGGVSNGAGVMQFGGNAVPFTNLVGSLGTSSFRWSGMYTTNVDATGTIVHSGVLTPTTLAASANDYAPTGHADTYLFRISASAAVNLTGLAGGVAGRKVTLTNVGANNIILSHDSASSTAANRWYGANNASVTLRPNGTVEAIYDNTSQRWRIFGA